MSFKYTSNALTSLQRTLSQPRLNRYFGLAGGDAELAVKHHEWNAHLSQALQLPLQSFEITLRNVLSEQLEITYGSNWFDAINGHMDAHWQRKLAEIKNDLSRKGKVPYSAPDIIAQTTFGYWVALMDSKYDRLWWKFCLQKAFRAPAPGFSRRRIHACTKTLNQLRNRIAHHEPVYDRPLDQELTDLLLVSRWICPDTGDWIDSQSLGFRNLWKNRPTQRKTVFKNKEERWGAINWNV